VNQEIKEKWIEALLSGNYKQGQNYLRDSGEQFCCLGVLCDLYVKEGHGQWEKEGHYWRLGGRNGFLSGPVMEWAGLTSSCGWEIQEYENDEDKSLVQMNDSGRTFVEIAEKIKEVL